MAFVALGILAGVGGGLALAALAGARRSDSAFDRLQEVTHASDAVVFISQAGVMNPDWTPLVGSHDIESMGSWGLPALGSEEVPGFGLFAPYWGKWATSVDRPIVDRGRAPDQSVPSEVMMDQAAADQFGLDVGDTVTAAGFTEDQFATDQMQAPEEPPLDFKVVGIGHSAFEATLFGGNEGFVWGSRALYEEQPELARIENLNVKLRPGIEVADFATHASEALGVQDLPLLDLRLAGKRVTNATHFERDGLALFALAVAVATLVLVGQAITRSVRSSAEEMPTLATLGLTRGERAATLALPHVLVVVTALVVAVMVALALSPLFPIGLSRGLDPDIGFHADWLVIASGAIAASLLMVGFTVFVAARAAVVDPNPLTARPSRLTQKVREVGAPLPVSLGVSLALESGRGKRALPTRPALVAVVAAVAGIVAATTFGTGITDALQHSERFGSDWDLEITPQSDPEISLDTVHGLLGHTDPNDIDAAAVVRKQQVTVEGHTQPTYSITPVSGSLSFAILKGRAPLRTGEVVVGPSTLREEGWKVGDTVSVDDGGSLEIVGEGLMPQTPHSAFDQGLWVTVDESNARIAEAEQAAAKSDPADKTETALFQGVENTLAVRLSDAAPADTEKKLTSVAEPMGFDVAEPSRPADLDNLEHVRSLPSLLAAFLVLLGSGALIHMAGSVVRRRRADLAVLRALGMTPHQARRALGWQSITLSAAGIAVGIPLGLVIGETVWRLVAQSIPMIYVPPFAAVALVITVAAVLMFGQLLVVIPARRAGKLPPAVSLRTE